MGESMELWLRFDEAEEAILSEAAARMGGGLRALIIESALAVARGDVGEGALEAIEEMIRLRRKHRECHSACDLAEDDARRGALLSAVGAEPPCTEEDRRPRRFPEAPPQCEEVAKALRERLKRLVQDEERRRQERRGDPLARTPPEDLWPRG